MVSTKREADTTNGKLPLPLRAIGLGLRAAAAVSPPLAAWGLERLFRTPKRQAIPAHEQSWLSRAQYAQIQVGVYRVATWSWGSGPTVLLVHGWGGRGSQLGAFIEPLVSRGYRVVAFDAPGHGRTNGTMSSLPEISQTVASLARHLGPVHTIIAHSVGAAATTLALRSPLEVQRLVYVALPAHPGEWLYWLADVLGASRRVPTGDPTVARRAWLPIPRVGADLALYRGFRFSQRLGYRAGESRGRRIGARCSRGGELLRCRARHLLHRVGAP